MQAAVEAVTAVALAVAQGLSGLRPMIPLLATAVTVRVKMLLHVVSCCFMLFHVVSCCFTPRHLEVPIQSPLVENPRCPHLNTARAHAERAW